MRRSYISKTRNRLYKTARFLGDVEAAERGGKAVQKRIIRRSMWRLFGLLFKKF